MTDPNDVRTELEPQPHGGALRRDRDESWLPDEPATLNERQAVFLEAIEAGCSYSDAAHIARVNRITAWRWRQDPEFAALVVTARKICTDKLVAEAERRALHGSDKLLEFLLVNYAPERFQRATQKVDLTANVKTQVQVVSEFDVDPAAGLV